MWLDRESAIHLGGLLASARFALYGVWTNLANSSLLRLPEKPIEKLTPLSSLTTSLSLLSELSAVIGTGRRSRTLMCQKWPLSWPVVPRELRQIL